MTMFHKRQGRVEINHCYFFTQTIQNFRSLLNDDRAKAIVIDSLKFLVVKELIYLYGYVIMHNHIHLLFYVRGANGAERVTASFSKYTAHQFKKILAYEGQLDLYKVARRDRQVQFWKRDPLAIELSSEKILQSKLAYIHRNPVKKGLCNYPEEYRWSSASFYFDGKDEFGILTHYQS